MCIDEAPQDLSRRSSSAWAKNALASFSISLARRSSLTSRSSAFTRCASAVVTPSRTPLSISCRWTQLSKVCGTQPIFGAIDATAAHNDGYSPRRSEEHTSELQSLMRISYAVFCLKKNKDMQHITLPMLEEHKPLNPHLLTLCDQYNIKIKQQRT